jgi:hypothetical protein
LWLAPSATAAPVVEATTTPTTSLAATAPWWYSPNETLLGPTAILLDTISYEDGQVVVRYDLRDVSPPALGRRLVDGEINPFFSPPPQEPVAMPDRWVLETVDGTITGTSESTRVRAARFDVPDDFVLGTITGLRVESYRIRTPYIYELDVAPVADTTQILDEGYSFTITNVIPQQVSVIFQIDVTSPHDPFTAGESMPVIIHGVGPEWVSSNQRQFEGLQLILGTSQIPDSLRLEVRTTYWVSFENSVAVDLRGVGIG